MEGPQFILFGTTHFLSLALIFAVMIAFPKIINEYLHDISSYTHGLEFYKGFLYESTGLNGFSSLKKLDVFNNKVLEKRFLDDQYFGEGLTVINDKIFSGLNFKSLSSVKSYGTGVDPV